MYLNKIWGPYTVDRFAAHYNSNCIRFNSRWWVPGTEAVHCFSENWFGKVNWLVPPPRLIAACIRKMRSDRSAGTLVIPEWKSASYWPLVLQIERYIIDMFVLPVVGAVKSGKGNNGMFSKEPFSFRMLALQYICRE